MKPWVALALSTSMLVACGGGGGSSPLPKAPTNSPAKASVQVKITMRVPGAASAHTAALKRRFTLAQSTAGAQVNVYTAGADSGTPLATAAANVEPSTVVGSTCLPSDSYGNRTCTFALSAPAGSDDFVITTWDQAPPSGGAIPGTALQLGVGTDPAVPIVAGTSASVNATLSSVLASVSLDLTPSVLHQLIPSTGTVGVYALDADNDVIVSNGFADPSGNPISISFASDNSLNGAFFLSTGSITAPSPSGIQYTYTPSGVLGTSANATVNVSASSSYSPVTTSGAALSALYPTFTSIADGNLSVNNIHHGGIVFDTSGGVYYTTPLGAGGISYYTGSGSAIASYAANLTAPLLGSVVNGIGTLYALLGNSENTFSAPPGSTLSAGPNASLAPVPNGSAIAFDPATSLLWYTSGSSLVSYPATSGAPTTTAIGVNATAGVAVDASSNVWVVDNANDRIIEVPGSNNPLQAGGAPWDVLTNVNGVYVTDHGPNPAILRLSTSGIITSTISIPGGATPWYMMPDNAQGGIIWFDYLLNGQIGIGRMDTNVTPASFVMATDVSGPTGSQAGAIGAASNGAVYMVFDNTSTLVQVTR